MPSFLLVISKSASFSGVAQTAPAGSPRRRASDPRPSTATACRAPRRGETEQNPPRETARSSNSATASASPIARVAVVLAVGASPRGQASSFTEISRKTSPARARALCGLPAMAINGSPMRLMTGRMRVNLLGLAGVGDGDDHIPLDQHAQIAVNPFGRMEEEGRGAGRSHSRGNLLADQPRLAHAGDHHPPLAGAGSSRPPRSKLAIDPVGQSQHRLGLDPQDLARRHPAYRLMFSTLTLTASLTMASMARTSSQHSPADPVR